MFTLYCIAITLVEKILPLSKFFSAKMKFFVNGRKSVISTLQKKLAASDQVIWLHAASLGEYEQGVPVLDEIKKRYPEYKIVISFFSPSGYEVKKNNPYAAVTVYLPLDTPKNAAQFVKAINPKLALFVKYEVWPNYLKELHQHKVPTFLISGIFRPQQIYFKPYGKFMKKALLSFSHIFVQTEDSYCLLKKEGLNQVTISGDTRFDRVNAQLSMDNHLDFIAEFKGDEICVVCGSTWPEDEQFLFEFINQSVHRPIKFIIAPHQIKKEHIQNIQSGLTVPALLFSEKENKKPQDFRVFIIDAVGYLSKIYAYGDIAYVGGAAGKTGLHNILEPATFGLPIIIGENHQRFPEASALQKEKGLFVVHTPRECTQTLKQLTENIDFIKNSGQNSRYFIKKNLGATSKIIDFIVSALKM